MMDKEILMAMSQFKVDNYGRPADRITSYRSNGTRYVILPMESLTERLTGYGLMPTYYAVFVVTSFGKQQVSNWYFRYGNAVKAMIKL